MVEKVVAMNGKPFDARDFEDENEKAVIQNMINMMDGVESGEFAPRIFAAVIVDRDDGPSFWFAGPVDEQLAMYGAIETMKQTFWETVIRDGE
jgi:hypothetical protein